MLDPQLEAAKASQEQLEREFGGKPGILGIGLGKGLVEDEYVVRVYVGSKSTAKSLPKKVGGVDIVPEVTGAIKAY